MRWKNLFHTHSKSKKTIDGLNSKKLINLKIKSFGPLFYSKKVDEKVTGRCLFERYTLLLVSKS